MVRLKNVLNKDYRFGGFILEAGAISEPLQDDEAAKLVVIANGQLQRVEEKVEPKVEEPKVEPKEEPEEAPEPEQKAYRCEKCNKTFNTERGLDAHRRIKKH